MSFLQARLSDLMEQKKLSPADIEKKSGLPKSTISSILTGASKNPSATTLRSIAKALDVSLEFVLSNEVLDFNTLNTEQLKALKKVTDKMIDHIIENHLEFTLDTLSKIVKEIYYYSIKTTPPSVDTRFIDWIVNKHHKI